MNKPYFILLSISLILFSCSDNNDRPEDILPEDKMVGILLDIHLAEARVGQAKMPKDSSLNYYVFLENGIFEKYGTDSAGYQKSMEYYTLNIRELDKIYEAVLDSLNIRSAQESRTQSQ